MKSVETAVDASLLTKVYETTDSKLEVLSGVNLTVRGGGFTVIGGPSGSGKTTLLNIIGGIDKPTSGKMAVFGEDLTGRNENFLSEFRCSRIGFVFQSYNLISTLTAAENVAFPMEWLRKPEESIGSRVEELLKTVGLVERREHFPFQLSGGEQQRVAFARALANDPPLLLVDEPTGNLDNKTSFKIVQILEELKREGKTVIVATHDERILDLASQKLWLEDGKLMKHDE
jgi:putative ABC transport system ATP-binding protein